MNVVIIKYTVEWWVLLGGWGLECAAMVYGIYVGLRLWWGGYWGR